MRCAVVIEKGERNYSACVSPWLFAARSSPYMRKLMQFIDAVGGANAKG